MEMRYLWQSKLIFLQKNSELICLKSEKKEIFNHINIMFVNLYDSFGWNFGRNLNTKKLTNEQFGIIQAATQSCS